MSTSAERMYNHLLSQFRNKPNIKALLDVVGAELDAIEEVRKQIRTQIWPDVAVGKQLDMCGEVADISRRVENVIALDFFGFPDHGDNGFGQAPFRRMIDNYLTSSDLNDRTYRQAIIAKIDKNTTDCSRVSTIRSIKKCFDVDKIIAVNAGNAKMRIGIGREVTAKEQRLVEELNLIIRGAGIGIIYVFWYEDENVFGFTRSGENYGNFTGFNDGGSFARIIKVKGGIVQ